MRRIVAPLGDQYGTASIDALTSWTDLATFYRVRAPRVTGVWEVTVNDPALTRRVEFLDVRYGEDVFNLSRPEQRISLPQVNGVVAVGGTHRIDAARAGELTGAEIMFRRRDPSRGEYHATAHTADRMAAVLRVILTDFLAQPDLDQLRRRSAARQAQALLEAESAAISKLDNRIADAVQERRRRRASLRRFANIVAREANSPLPR